MALSLLERSFKEAGENWQNAKLDGVEFEFDEEIHNIEWLPYEGVLELDYMSHSLRHESNYVLDLSNPMDHATAYKLLDRVWHSEQESGPRRSCDTWDNLLIDGTHMDLSSWAVNFTVKTKLTSPRGSGSASMGKGSGGGKYKARSVASRWRVPHKGHVTFNYLTRNPQHLYTQHVMLDLSDGADRATAQTLRYRARNNAGENWWNLTMDGCVQRKRREGVVNVLCAGAYMPVREIGFRS